MIEQTWWNTPWYRITLKDFMITNGEALFITIVIFASIAFLIFVGYVFGKQRR